MTCRNRKLKVGTRRVGTNARNRWNSALSEAPWQLITNQRAAARIESSTAAAVAAARLTVQLDRELVRVAWSAFRMIRCRSTCGPARSTPGALEKKLQTRGRGGHPQNATPAELYGRRCGLFSAKSD